MRAQLFTVPFENLDVQAGKIVSMTPENIVQNRLSATRRLLLRSERPVRHGLAGAGV